MAEILNKINSPADLKKLGQEELKTLATEIRKLLIQTVSHTGGHLASNLGVVELTIVLHRVFDSPKDKIIWDVGHQCYTHKLLTGRKNYFATLRQYKGLCGFPQREESEHDHFNTGHASTAISAALGMALSRDFKKEKHKIIAVVGDGSLTGGMAFEGLNQAGALKRDLIIVLNDNKMSISKNVGGLSVHLNEISSLSLFDRSRRLVWIWIKKTPYFGKLLSKIAEYLRIGYRSLLKIRVFFEQIGIKYVGPVNGHNLAEMLEIFNRVKNLSGPILVHVVTQKGKGYKFAEKNPTKYHSASSFYIHDGKWSKKPQKLTYTEVFARTLIKLARENKKIVGITAAMPDGTGLAKFAQEFPDRFFDVGIAEQHATTFAAGLAIRGFRPFLAIYSTFLQRAFDQIIHDVALQNLPVIFMIDRAGIVGDDGPTHHGNFDLSYLRLIPNLVISTPKDENELQHLIKTAEVYKKGPFVCRYPRGEGVGIKLDLELKPLPIGKGEELKNGQDLYLLACGSMVYPCLTVAERLEKQGMSIGVINARFIKPLDEELILKATKCERVLTVEENTKVGGFGSAVLEVLEKYKVKNVRVERIGIPDSFIPHGSPELLKKEIGLDEESIQKKALQMLEKV
ncbi:MAG: 1-deoxy-D-xylulose-5-phosphate synthase [Patescibacteria group bacterium]|nr:1-deoxy-D-xylulose-5-phosphate synthase [Patescibacteria group bacterium]